MADETPPQQENEGSYNTTFERLVRDDTDIVGMIAYAKYKHEKREWATKVREKCARGPNATELDGYVSTITDARVQGLREQAEVSINAFAEEVIEANRPDIERNLLEGSFERDIRNGVIASIIYTVLLIAVAFILKGLGVDLLDVYQSIGGAADQPPTTTP